MEEYNKIRDLIHDDELVHDFEFAERLYAAGLTMEMNEYYYEKNLIWQDMI